MNPEHQEPQSADPISPVSPEHSDAERRRALLRGLAKGGAALGAAGLPIHSHASRYTLTATGTQCSVSGNQSAVVSLAGSTATNCAGFAPSALISVSSVSLSGGNGTVAAALQISVADVQSLKAAAATGAPVIQSVGAGCIYIGVAGGATCTKVAPVGARWTGTGVLALFSSLFAGGPSKTLLETLYATSLSASSAEGWFTAAYLSANIATVPTNTGGVPYVVPGAIVHVPFSAASVVSSYPSSNALSLYKLVCVATA